jgi:hypothetical protein
MAKLPTDDDVDGATAAFESYFMAAGRVVHAWNDMQEELGRLFCDITGMSGSMGMAVWHSLRSDLAQRQMLKAAIEQKAGEYDFGRRFPKAQADIGALLGEINKLSDRRNAAVHAPCSIVANKGEIEIFPIPWFGNPNAAKLAGKNILAEFEWYERTAIVYRSHVRQIAYALSHPEEPWPDKPRKPTLGEP